VHGDREHAAESQAAHGDRVTYLPVGEFGLPSAISQSNLRGVDSGGHQPEHGRSVHQHQSGAAAVRRDPRGRAAAYAIDRQALLRARYPDGYRGTPATHLFPDILEDGLLRDFDPYPGPDLDAARAEMRRSRHDSDGDGRCDAKECEQVLAITPEEASATRAAKELTRQLEPIGIHLRVATCCQTMYGKCSDPLTPTRSVWRTCSVPITRMR